MLTIKIYSFSYLYTGIPDDSSGNGGGFVFDCRFISNPGRLIEFMSLTGKDEEVKKFLDDNADMQSFLKKCYEIVETVIKNYMEKDFTNLMICFGCTGGRHRSVYAAENLKSHLINRFDDKVIIKLYHKNI